MRPTLIPLAIAAVITVTACGSNSSGGGDGASDLYLSAADIRLLIESAPAPQQRFVEDAVVTNAEREAAYLEFIGCMADQGVTTVAYDLRPNGGDGFEQDTGSLPAEQVDAITSSCRSQHYVEVGAVYEFNNRLSEEEQQAILRETAECMRGKGLDVVDGASLDQMNEVDRGEAALCWDAASR